MSEKSERVVKCELRQAMIEIGRSLGFDVSGSEGELPLENYAASPLAKGKKIDLIWSKGSSIVPVLIQVEDSIEEAVLKLHLLKERASRMIVVSDEARRNMFQEYADRLGIGEQLAILTDTEAEELLEHCRELEEYMNRLRLKEVSYPLEIPVDVKSFLDRLSVQNLLILYAASSCSEISAPKVLDRLRYENPELADKYLAVAGKKKKPFTRLSRLEQVEYVGRHLHRLSVMKGRKLLLRHRKIGRSILYRMPDEISAFIKHFIEERLAHKQPEPAA